MNTMFSWFPVLATTLAGQVDLLHLLVIAFGVIATLLAVALMVWFGVNRRPAGAPASGATREDCRLELACGTAVLLLVLGVFGWSAKIHYAASRTPPGAMEIFVTGKQWMWKLQHPNGKREINELHVPAGQPIQLTLTSEDVVHQLAIPAFRVKQEVVPGRETTVWFEADKPGTYSLTAPGYSSIAHGQMGGPVYVMRPADYERWLAGGGAAAETPAEAGLRIFNQLGCATCHAAGPGQLGPNLAGLIGSTRKFMDGSELVADEAYVRESILNSQAKLVAGYAPVMPLFKGMINEDQLLNVIAYIKSLGGPAGN